MAIFGISATLAVTALLAGGVVQLSAELAHAPDYLHASVAAFDRAGLARHRPADRVERIARNDRIGRLPRTSHPREADDGPARAGPRFADLDPGRFSSPRSAEGSQSSGARSTWRSVASLDDNEPRSAIAAAYPGVDWSRQFASAPSPAADAIFAPVQVAKAFVDEGSRAGRPSQSSEAHATSAAGDQHAASVTLASATPLPRARPDSPHTATPEVTGPATDVLAANVVPVPRPEHSADAAGSQPHSALAYANPDAAAEKPSGGLFGHLLDGGHRQQLPGPGSHVAVYDIETATVYMPDGQRLEAHSGLAGMQDDPRYVDKKNRGPTPPNVYNLVMRESLFHGVEAVRLLPSDGQKKYNRDGLLAHSYMYAGGGSRSQSNGCVVFKNYGKFLTAFKRGEIKHMIVVPNLEKLPTYMASL